MRLFLVLLPLVILTACGGSRSRSTNVERCKDDFLKAHKMSLSGHKKVDLDAPNGEIASANLSFKSSSIFVYDKTRDIRINIVQYNKKEKTVEDYKGVCFGGEGKY